MTVDLLLTALWPAKKEKKKKKTAQRAWQRMFGGMYVVGTTLPTTTVRTYAHRMYIHFCAAQGWARRRLGTYCCYTRRAAGYEVHSACYCT